MHPLTFDLADDKMTYEACVQRPG